MKTVLCAAVIVLFATALASACTCVPPLEAECQQVQAKRKTLFIGRVDSIGPKTALLPPDRYPVKMQVVTFRVVENFGGDQSGELSVTDWAPANGSCGFPFVLGHTYLVDASVAQEDNQWHLNSCGRTADVSDVEDLVRLLRSAGANDSGIIFGTVKEFVGEKKFGAKRNKAISGATVIVRGVDGEKTIVTDSAGWFYVRDLSPGEYAVRVDVPPEYAPAQIYSFVLPRSACAQVDFATDRIPERQ